MMKSFTIKLDDPEDNISIETLYDSIIEGISEFGYDVADLVIIDNDNPKQSIHMKDVEREM